MPSHVDEFGTALTAKLKVVSGAGCPAPLDLTGATITFLLKKPSGVVIEVAAAYTGSPTKGTAAYVITAGQLDEVGVWEWQPKIVKDDGQWWGDRADFTVDDHLVPDP